MPWTTDEEIRVERDGRPESLPSMSRYTRRVLSMLKPFTLSLSLAVALGLCSVSKAGLHDNNCTTCGLASPQGVVASPQGSYAGGCGAPACGKKHHFNFGGLKNLFQHQVTYEWVLKKKHSFHLNRGCSTCGGGAVYATGQGGAAPSGQHAAAPSGQYGAPSGQYSAPAYGAGQRAFIPARSTTSVASVPAEMIPANNGGEDVPPAPELKATGSQGGLLLPTPSGN
jgi:hypothetical protein